MLVQLVIVHYFHPNGLTATVRNEDLLPQETLSLSLFSTLTLVKRQTLCIEGTAKKIDSLWPYSMEFLKLCLANPG